MSVRDSDIAKRLEAVRHVVHDYANFVSSAEMVLTGRDIDGAFLKPPINTHVSHAFYLNCRKMADFFSDKGRQDDIKAKHYVDKFSQVLTTFGGWREAINKQLGHLTYTRDTTPRPIDTAACKAMYEELKGVWRSFRAALTGDYE